MYFKKPEERSLCVLTIKNDKCLRRCLLFFKHYMMYACIETSCVPLKFVQLCLSVSVKNKFNLGQVWYFKPVAHTSSYFGGGDWEDCGLRPNEAKCPQDLITTNKSWVWWYVPVTSATQKCNWGITVWAGPGHKSKTLFKK
jgi:hypothetical protein